MKINILIAAAALGVATPAIAAPYSFEVEGLYSRSDARFVETTVQGADGTWYWQTVDTTDAPLAEAAFADRANSVTVGLSRASQDATGSAFSAANIQPSLNIPALTPPSTPDYVIIAAPPPTTALTIVGPPVLAPQPDADAYRGAARYVHESGWLGEASLLRSRSDEQRSFTRIDSDTTDLSLGIGKYLAKNLTVTFAYARRKIDSDSSIEVCLSLFDCQTRTELATGTSDETKTWSANARYLASAGRTHHAVAGSIAYATRATDSRTGTTVLVSPNQVRRFDDRTYFSEIDVAYIFYPRSDFGAGIAFSHFDGEFGSDNAMSISLSWFVTERIGLRARYSNQRQAFEPDDADTLAFVLTGRF